MDRVTLDEAEAVYARYNAWRRKHPDSVMTATDQWAERAAWTILVLDTITAKPAAGEPPPYRSPDE